jgi:putative intracellular protease/amidase
MQMRARTILIGGKAVDRGNDGKHPVRCDRCEIVVATSGGVVPHVDVMSLRPSMAGSEEIALEQEGILRSAEELRHLIELADARLEDYDAVYYPSGHGPMEDLWQDADSGRLLIAALASGKPLAIVCHAPVAIMATRRKGESAFAKRPGGQRKTN